LLLGAAVAWLYARSRSVTAGRELEKELDVNREKLAMAGSSLASAEKNLEEERNKVSELNRELAIAGEKERSMQEKYEHYQKEVDKLQEKFKLEFENIASKILKQNTLDFSVSNQKSINEVINPPGPAGIPGIVKPEIVNSQLDIVSITHFIKFRFGSNITQGL